MKNYLFLLIAFFSSGLIQHLYATHIRAGEITAELVSCQGYTYRITITGYEDTESGIEFGEGVLDMGDGNVFILDPNTDFVTRTIIDGDKQIRVTVFEKVYTFPGAGGYTITYREQNRNQYILNMANSVETPFFIQTQVNADPFFCNTTPVLTNPPVDGAVVGQTFTHNPGAYDKDGDSLAFKMVVPLQDKGLVVDDYTYPDEYDRDRGDNTNPIRQDGSQPVFLEIDAETGTVTWDAPANPGEYNISFIIEEWRKIEGEWVFLGYVTRDMQIIVEDADNERPEIADLPDTCIVAGSLVEWAVPANDPDGDQMYFTAFGEAFDFQSSPATFSPDAMTPVNSPAEGLLRWQTSCAQVRTAPYQMNIKVNDLPSSGPTLADYMDFNVTIVGPAPILNTISQQEDVIGLQWNAYACANQAVGLSLYRKKGESSFTPDVCQTGIPDGLGFEKIAEMGAGLMAYRDTNDGEAFEPGVTYCYRLLATYPDGSESLASEEFCTTIPTNASFLTKVSVLSTSTTDGRIEINWSRSLNPDALPENFNFTLLRGTGFTSTPDGELEVIASGLTDTLFVDEELNTEDEVYHYQVVITDTEDQALEYSAKASSARLSAQAERGSVSLNWQAEVPWSNQTNDYPYHYIYRTVGEAPELAEMELLDSVLVTNIGFTFIDDDLPETESTDVQICYVIQTQGRYSLELPLPTPLLNFSQRICVSPLDSIPPCPPTALLIDNGGIDACTSFLEGQSCDFSGYENRLEWQVPQNECAADLAGYNIYFSADGEADYQKIASLVQDNFYVDGPLSSYAGCYRIAAVDLSGNESEWSEPFCRDNCPNFALPNVFTPNGDGVNETFEALGEPLCPRFVERVQLWVYNRWGKQVFNYDSEENQQRESNLVSYWDGTTESGARVSAGVYYYHAEVTFKVLDPDRASRKYKGWVQVAYEEVIGR
ncbi:T9SS type B sorting domain-containing protein [Catalinimonas niigatensis]|uniref:T9SS type B sorting domain-containing protein n=1 Tax=Catalinimonas niigatensis TaxID=1397264 RepID=UPI002665D807|nr:gliding motility-associated C-terminal domain-containing protein [Catalinimonas niigatensis]WPP50984.1 gliding motility-associated C-terminal domain-containing protein [Catalinimonas niigatensis]